MIIFLYGKDGYRLKQNLEKITAEYGKKNAGGMGFLVLDLEEGAREQLVKLEDAIKTLSFFDEKKLIQLKNAFSDSEAVTDIIKKYDLTGDKQIILVVIENGTETEIAKKNRKLFNLLSAKPNLAKKFDPLAGKQLENWIVKEAEDLGVKFESRALAKLINLVGDDSWALKQEIDKLANYCTASGLKNIGEKEVDLLITPKINLNIFEAVDALANRDKGKTIILLNKHLQAGEDPYYLFSMFVYQFRNLLRVKDLLARYTPAEGIIKKTGLHPFVVKKTIGQAQKFELEELKKKFLQLADSDIRIKNGLIDIVDCLYQIALS